MECNGCAVNDDCPACRAYGGPGRGSFTPRGALRAAPEDFCTWCRRSSGASAPALSTVGAAALAGEALPAQSSGMDLSCLSALLSQQSGVVSRRQLLRAGLTDNDIARLLRRRELARVHSGVYVDHTGPLSWLQRAWAATLSYWPAALCDDSALLVSGVRGVDPAGPIQVAVDEERRVVRKEGVRVRRVTRLPSLVQPNRTPPRMRLEHALLGSASRAVDDAHAIAVLADACQQRLLAARVLHSCRAALVVARLLKALGWTGDPKPCGPGCRRPSSAPAGPGRGRSQRANRGASHAPRHCLPTTPGRRRPPR